MTNVWKVEITEGDPAPAITQVGGDGFIVDTDWLQFQVAFLPLIYFFYL